MRRILFMAVAVSGLVLFAQHGVYSASPPPVLLAGPFSLNTTGQAVLSEPTSGNCSVSGSVPAALENASIIFDRNGTFSGSGPAISIGATSCTSVNYNISGSYTVVDDKDGTVEVTGTLSTRAASRGPVVCQGTGLRNVSFTLVLTVSDRSFTITTEGAGAGSGYAEGDQTRPFTTCTATILNFITSGSGRRL